MRVFSSVPEQFYRLSFYPVIMSLKALVRRRKFEKMFPPASFMLSFVSLAFLDRLSKCLHQTKDIYSVDRIRLPTLLHDFDHLVLRKTPTSKSWVNVWTFTFSNSFGESLRRAHNIVMWFQPGQQHVHRCTHTPYIDLLVQLNLVVLFWRTPLNKIYETC